MEKPTQRILSGQAFDEDARIEASVRPQRFGDFIGQTRLKENLAIAVEAARTRWLQAKEAGHALTYWQQTEKGWEKRASGDAG